ncbi:MAG TPA: succinylglutamate desuccinylase/aspartoacylase family protein [Gemmatimonadota bacterium]
MVGGVEVPPGEVRRIALELTEVAIRVPLPMPVTVVHGARPGPRLFLTAGIHGDELNGVAIVREVCRLAEPERLAGALLCVPVVNVPAFLARTRDLPDGTDLNRFFPGRASGKPAARVAHLVMREIVAACDAGIDFHSAAVGRANLPHVRADMDRAGVRPIAKAFGTRIVVHKRGHRRSLRRAATDAGAPTIVLEAGETGRLQKTVVSAGLRGVRNVLVELGMVEDARRDPSFQVVVRNSVWVRAQQAGLFELSAAPGDLVYAGDRIGTYSDPFGGETRPIHSPTTGLVVGVSRNPVCDPGSPLCHLARVEKTLATVERHLQRRARA